MIFPPDATAAAVLLSLPGLRVGGRKEGNRGATDKNQEVDRERERERQKQRELEEK